MGIEKDIIRLFQKVIDEYGSARQAAAHLDTNNVTLWNWVTGKRSLNPALCKAIDKAGGILLIPGERMPEGEGVPQRIAQLEDENAALKQEVESLKRYQAMWEGHIETVRAQSGMEPIAKKA